MKPEPKRWRLENAMLGVVLACVFAILLTTLASRTTVAARAGDPAPGPRQENAPGSPPATAEPAAAQHFEGMVTCSRCGAKHSPLLERPATQCAITCVREGASFALVDREKTYQLEGDLSMLKRLAGQRAQVVGVAQGETIKVASIGEAR